MVLVSVSFSVADRQPVMESFGQITDRFVQIGMGHGTVHGYRKHRFATSQSFNQR